MILIFPWAAKTTDGTPSPKNYPYWDSVVANLLKARYSVLQVSRSSEKGVAGVVRKDDLPLDEIARLIRESETWLSVDSFAHHMAWMLGEPGVAIFGSSDPTIFGHPENINLLKNRKYLRDKQFWLWSQESADPDRFVGPEAVINAALLSIEKRKKR